MGRTGDVSAAQHGNMYTDNTAQAFVSRDKTAIRQAWTLHIRQRPSVQVCTFVLRNCSSTSSSCLAAVGLFAAV